MIILSIQEGELVANQTRPSRTVLASRELTAADLKKTKAFFDTFEGEPIAFSSSIDFPEEDGGPDVERLRAFLAHAMHPEEDLTDRRKPWSKPRRVVYRALLVLRHPINALRRMSMFDRRNSGNFFWNR